MGSAAPQTGADADADGGGADMDVDAGALEAPKNAFLLRIQQPLQQPVRWSAAAKDAMAEIVDLSDSDADSAHHASPHPVSQGAPLPTPQGDEGGSPAYATSTATADGVSYPSDDAAASSGSDQGVASRETFSLTGLSSAAPPTDADADADADAGADAGALEAPSAIIQRMRQRMAAVGPAAASDSDADSAHHAYPYPVSAASAAAHDTLLTSRDSGDDGSLSVGPADTHNRTPGGKRHAAGVPRGSPAKTDGEEEDEEEGEYDAAEEDRRYQAARAALRGIIRAHPPAPA